MERSIHLTMRVWIMALAAALSLGGAAFAETRLIMVEEPGCVWCARWNKELGDIYPKSAEGKAAPLLRIEIGDTPTGLKFVRRLSFTPTFVLMVDGEETGRIEGYPGEDFFWGLLGQMLQRANIPYNQAG